MKVGLKRTLIENVKNLLCVFGNIKKKGHVIWHDKKINNNWKKRITDKGRKVVEIREGKN